MYYFFLFLGLIFLFLWLFFRVFFYTYFAIMFVVFVFILAFIIVCATHILKMFGVGWSLCNLFLHSMKAIF